MLSAIPGCDIEGLIVTGKPSPSSRSSMRPASLLWPLFSAASFVVRPVVVVARLAVVAASATGFLALATVPLAPDEAGRAVVVAPDSGCEPFWRTPSVAAEAAPRTLFGRVRATVEPVGDTFAPDEGGSIQAWVTSAPYGTARRTV